MSESFEYGGYHFTPYRKFTKAEDDFSKKMQRAGSDFGMGLSTYGWKKADYSYEGFYAASTDKNCDLFKCAENGRIYMPALNELFIYREPKQRSREPSGRKSAVAALDKAKEAAAAVPAAKPKAPKGPEL